MLPEGTGDIKLLWDSPNVSMGQKMVLVIKASQGELSISDQSSSPESTGPTCGRWQPAGHLVVQCHLHEEQQRDAEALWTALAESVHVFFSVNHKTEVMWRITPCSVSGEDFPPLPSSKKHQLCSVHYKGSCQRQTSLCLLLNLQPSLSPSPGLLGLALHFLSLLMVIWLHL